MTTSVDMPTRIEKKHSVRFVGGDINAPISTVYIDRSWVALNDGCPNGVRVTIEPLEADYDDAA